MNWRRCDECGHVFTDGYFTSEALGILFARTHDNQRVGHDFEGQRLVSARIVARVAKYVSEGRWLDIGFGNGSLLFTCDEWGFRPIGTDLRSQSVQALRALGYEAYCAPIEDVKLPELCGVISMADVLEHMPYPRRALGIVNRLLRIGGVVFLSMPNMGSMAWRLLDRAKANPYWGEIEHYHNFSRASLCRLLGEHGFEPIEYNISERYRACMEIIAIKRDDVSIEPELQGAPA
jgi:SAM-dependent methyltransferase